MVSENAERPQPPQESPPSSEPDRPDERLQSPLQEPEGSDSRLTGWLEKATYPSKTKTRS